MKSNLKLFLSVACLALLMAACGEGKSTSSTNEQPTVEGNDYLVTIKTDMGEMKAILYDETPKHKENFIKLVEDGFYDSLLFHRVMDGFMIQGGDPDSKTATLEQPLGTGGPGYTIEAEFVKELIHEKGALSAARQPDAVNPQKASSGSQFFIVQGQVYPREQLEGGNQGKVIQAFRTLMQTQPNHELAQEYQQVLSQNPGDNAAIQAKVDATLDRLSEATGMTFTMPEDRVEKYSTVGGTPFLDDDYTVFGKVISGLEVIDEIAKVPTRNPQREDRPFENIRMYISVEEMPRAEIQKKFGYQYPVPKGS